MLRVDVKTRLFILLLLIVTANGFAQTKIIDSLKRDFLLAETISQKQAAIFNLCEQGLNMNPDSLLAIANEGYLLAINEKNHENELWSNYYQSIAYTSKGLIDTSLNLAESCVSILVKEKKYPALLGNFYNQIGRCYMRKNEYRNAIEMGYKTIIEAEKAGDILLQIKGKTLIGWAYLEMGQPVNSLNWHLKAARTSNDSTILENYAILFANISLNYSSLRKQDSAFYYIEKAVRYSRKNENIFSLSNSLAIQSQLFIKSGSPQPAENLLKEVVSIRKQIGDPFYVVSDMSQLGLYYAHYGMPQKGIKICNEGIEIARHYKLETKLLFLYGSLGDNYKALGNKEKYAEVLEKIISLKDTVYQKNSSQSIAEVQTKYDLQKKENLIILQKLEITRKNYFVYGLLIFSLFTILAALLLFREYKKRQKIKIRQMQDEEKQLSEIAVLKAGELERKRIAADLHDNLGAYAASIASNLDQIDLKNYDETDNILLQELRNNSQAIVSQLIDTIWVLKKDSLSLTAISDRIKVFLQRISASYPKINMEVLEKIHSDTVMPAAQAFHLFQIMQEGLNNAVKHSTAENINIIIESDKHWKVTIEDDGKGIGISSATSSPDNGIFNMKNRCKESGWNIQWLPVLPHGCRVEIMPTTI